MKRKKAYLKEKCIDVDGIYTIFSAEYGPEFSFDGESHNFWELVYVIDGKVGITADDRVYNFSAGDIIFHKPMEFHKIYSLENTKITVFVLTFSAKGRYTAELENKTLKIDAHGRRRIEELSELAAKAFDIENSVPVGIKEERSAQRFFNLFENFLLGVAENNEISVAEDTNSKLFGDIIGIMSENISANVSIEYIAERCFVSTAKLKKVFKRYTGMGVMAYFTEMKIKKAMELLKSGMSVGETAEQLSYSSQFYLSRVFKKVTGITPSEYKKG